MPLSVMMIRNRKTSRCFNAEVSAAMRPGVALLVVLFIVATGTVLALGFLSRSDIELQCGQNMILKTSMDYLAESGLEHARGLILCPQDVAGAYWSGDVGQQLDYDSEDFYDVNVVKLDECDWRISSTAYRQRGGQLVGRSSLEAELRLDPVVALWVGTSTTVWPGATVNGDVYCNGSLTNMGAINGDVFADSISGNSPTGQIKPAADLSLGWPNVTVSGFISYYPNPKLVTEPLWPVYGPYSPLRILYSSFPLELPGGVTVETMLIVDGNSTITGSNNIIRAGENVPALLVTGDLIVEPGASLEIEGLAVVDGSVHIDPNSGGVNISGGLFIAGGLDDSGGNLSITAAPVKTAIFVWSAMGEKQKWQQSAGAFYRSIKRN